MPVRLSPLPDRSSITGLGRFGLPALLPGHCRRINILLQRLGHRRDILFGEINAVFGALEGESDGLVGFDGVVEVVQESGNRLLSHNRD